MKLNLSHRMSNNIVSNKRIFKNTIFLYVRMGFVMFVTLYITRIVLKTLGVVDYGIYNVVCGFVSMFGFLNTSMSNGIQRFYNFEMGQKGEASITNVYNTALRIQMFLALLILLFVEVLGLWYLNYKMNLPAVRIWVANWIFQFSVLSLLFTIIQVPYVGAIMAYERMDYYAVVSIFDVVLKLIVVLFLPYLCFDKLWSYGLFLLCINILNFLLYYLYCKYKFKQIRLTKKFDKNLIRPMLMFSGWNTMGTFAYMIKSQGVNVLLNVFWGAAINAANGIASQVSAAIQSFSLNIVMAFKPQLTQSYAIGDYNRVSNIMFGMTKISYVLLYTLTVPLIIEIRYILHLWLGDQIPNYTIPLTILSIIVMLVSSFHTPLVQVFQASGKLKTFEIYMSIIICLILPVSWIVLNFGGDPMSVYWVTLCLVVVNHVVSLYVLNKIFNVDFKRYILNIILPCFLYTIFLPLIPLCISLLLHESFYRLVLVCLVTVVAAVLFVFFIALDKLERRIVLSYLCEKYKK